MLNQEGTPNQNGPTASHRTRALGIDGGGTSTRLLLLEWDDGQIPPTNQRAEWIQSLRDHSQADGPRRVMAQAGSGNLHDVGDVGLTQNLQTAWLALWKQMGSPPQEVDQVFACMASVVTEVDRERVRSAITSIGIAHSKNTQVDHDLRGSLAGGLAGAPGIAVIAGTGSSCFGRTADGRTWSAGGWGSFLDDRGSAFDLGRGAMIAAVRASDGRGPQTTLSDSIWNYFQLSHWRELLARVDDRGLARNEVAALAPMVTNAAEGGDAVAHGLLASGTAELALAVRAVAEHLRWLDPAVVATGGLANSTPQWSSLFKQAVLQEVPLAQISIPICSPLEGALLLALSEVV